MNDVVTCNVRAGEEGHSATFPQQLILPRIATSCPKGGIMLDPFSGSGRALTTAVKLGRRAIGFDGSAGQAGFKKKRLKPGDLSGFIPIPFA